MKVKLSLVLLVVALIAVTAYGQTGLAGKWVGELSAADGHGVAQPITLDLKVEGDAVSGTVAEGALEARPIMGASTEGTTVTFRTTRNLGGSDINVNWKGELKGEEMMLTREIGPAPAEAGGRGGRGGGGGGAAPAAGGRGGGRGGAAAGGQRGAAAPAAGAPAAAAPATPVPPVPAAQTAETPDANAAAAAGGRGAGRGGAAAAGGQRGGGGGGGRGGAAAAAPPPGPTVTLTLRRSR